MPCAHGRSQSIFWVRAAICSSESSGGASRAGLARLGVLIRGPAGGRAAAASGHRPGDTPAQGRPLRGQFGPACRRAPREDVRYRHACPAHSRLCAHARARGAIGALPRGLVRRARGLLRPLRPLLPRRHGPAGPSRHGALPTAVLRAARRLSGQLAGAHHRRVLRRRPCEPDLRQPRRSCGGRRPWRRYTPRRGRRHTRRGRSRCPRPPAAV